MSGPREIVRSKHARSVSSGMDFPSTPKMEHIKSTSVNGRLSCLDFRTKAAAPWCHLICFSFRVPTNPGRDNVLPSRRTYWANDLPFSLDLEGFFARWRMRDSHRRPLSGMPPWEWARASFPPDYSSSATLLIWNFAGILSWQSGVVNSVLQLRICKLAIFHYYAPHSAPISHKQFI